MPTDPTDSEVESGDRDHERRVSLAAVDGPPEFPVRPTVAVDDPRATADGPPRLSVGLTNRSERPLEITEPTGCRLFGRVRDSTGALVLHRADYHANHSVEPGTWRVTKDRGQGAAKGIVWLDPGETERRPRDLYGAVGGEGPLPTGSFRFETRLQADADPEPAESALWGFRIRIRVRVRR